MVKDANLLVSIVNTALRDKYSSLEDYCLSEDVDVSELTEILSSAGFTYDANTNSFK